MTQLIRLLTDLIGDKPTLFIAAMLPVIELRGAIPLGIALGMEPINSAILSFFGSLIPAPFIIFGIRPIFILLRRLESFRRFVDLISNRSLNNHGHKIQKYGVLGLVLLVAIPLPGTGVWSGSLIAALLDIRFKWAFPAIVIGNLIAAIAILLLTNGLVSVLALW